MEILNHLQDAINLTAAEYHWGFDTEILFELLLDYVLIDKKKKKYLYFHVA